MGSRPPLLVTSFFVPEVLRRFIFLRPKRGYGTPSSTFHGGGNAGNVVPNFVSTVVHMKDRFVFFASTVVPCVSLLWEIVSHLWG